MESIKLRKVLIALDYDLSAMKVAETGILLAESMGAKVILCHVISDPSKYINEHILIKGFIGHKETELLKPESMGELKKVAESYLDKINGQFCNEAAQVVVKEGDIADTIMEITNNSKVDTIVLGSLSRKRKDNNRTGTVVDNLLNVTSVPLFIIPTKNTIKP